MYMEQNLSKAQHEILKCFINDFLPENDRLIQDPVIELTYITRILNSLFQVWFNFKIQAADLFAIFEEYRYAFSVVEPRRASRKETPYIETNSGAIYVGIPPLAIQELELVIPHLNDNAIAKTARTQELMAQLEAFKQRNF